MENLLLMMILFILGVVSWGYECKKVLIMRLFLVNLFLDEKFILVGVEESISYFFFLILDDNKVKKKKF